MAYSFPEGASIQFSQTFASAKTITALTNANPAVATSVAHGFTTGDEVLINTGWEDCTDTVVKVTVLTADTFSLTGVDTTDTGFFPPGAGTGSAQKISGWTAIPQILTVSASGGDARFTDVQLLAKRNAIKIPTGFNATSITLSLAYDGSQPGYISAVGVSRKLTKVALKQVLSGGNATYGYGYLAVSEFPKLNSNSVNTVDAAMTMIGRVISY